MTDERDAMLDRVVEALKPLPHVDETAKARVLIAVAAERERDREAAARQPIRRPMRTWVIGATGLAAAGLLAVVLLRAPSRTGTPPQPATTAAVPAPRAPQLAANSPEATLEAARVPVQLVFRAPTASQVRVVGDFNGWDGERAAMTRDAASGLWSLSLVLKPGRHVYAFVVDDTLWVRDPRAPAAKDTDFGRPGSVLLVGRP